MDEQNVNRKIKEAINDSTEDLSRSLVDLESDINDLKDKNLNKELKLIKSYTKSIMDDEGKLHQECLNNAQNLFRAITIVGNIEAELDIISDSISTISTSQSPHSSKAQSIIGKISSWIKPMIKKLSSRLWQFLSQMMNLSHWSVTGQTNVNLCGFSGGVSLQLNFEK